MMSISANRADDTQSEKDPLFGFFESLVHPLRVKILTLLYENERMSYSELLERLNIETGKLNFHFKKLSGLIEKDVDGNYKLTSKGVFAIGAIKAVREQLGIKEETKQKSFFLRRFFAWLIDVALVSLIGLGGFLFFDFSYTPGLPFNPNIDIPIPTFFYTLIGVFFTPYVGWTVVETETRLFMLSILWIYWTIFEGYRGQSIGKIVMGIRIIKTDGSIPQILDTAILSLGKTLLLPIDLIVGVILRITKKGYWIRFTEAYVRVKTVRASLSL